MIVSTREGDVFLREHLYRGSDGQLLFIEGNIRIVESSASLAEDFAAQTDGKIISCDDKHAIIEHNYHGLQFYSSVIRISDDYSQVSYTGYKDVSSIEDWERGDE